MTSSEFHLLLEKHVPQPAVAYCFSLWQEKPFQLRLRKSRVSKVGDFSCRPGKEPTITVNADSHPNLFLITYVHEVAHFRVHTEFGRRTAPHGKEWKNTFRQLCQPLLDGNVFPPDVNHQLTLHLHNPKASSFSDTHLNRMLRKHDDRLSTATLLGDIPEGSEFQIRGRWFIKGKMKRTRIVCRELKTRRNYLIAMDAIIGN